MIRVAAITGHYPCPTRPTDGRTAFQTMREFASRADVQVFHPNAAHPSWLRFSGPTNGNHNTSFSPPPGIKVNYYHYPGLPLISRPINGWVAARALLPHVRNFAPDLILSYFIYPFAFTALQIGKALGVPVVAGGMGSDIHSIGDPISAMHTRTVLRNADFLFAISVDLEKSKTEVDAIKANAAKLGRNTGVFTLCHVVCRPTKKEADEYYRYYAHENADWGAVDNLMRLQGMHAQSFPAEALQMLRDRFAAGHGTYPLVGDPDTIVNEMEKIPASGFAGTTLSFVDYVKEFPHFRDEVMPRLEKKGLREKFDGQAAAD